MRIGVIGVLVAMVGCGSALPPRTFSAPREAMRCWTDHPLAVRTPVPANEVWLYWSSLNADDAPDGNVSLVGINARFPDRTCGFDAGEVPEGCRLLPQKGDILLAVECAHSDFDERVLLGVRRDLPSRLAVRYSVLPADRSNRAALHVTELGAFEIAAHTQVVVREY
jgi:hypothetical protein